ncbi:LysE family transporter [Acidovorax sp. D2M1]|uniref:LysE family transporter n=1 Tax=Acidovorax benzenivorans TaxID=2987520 RepID=A0ABT5RYX7_9BURK|nr:LysE family transporter [Acidovorax benzenivorans]MDD2178895.1 LysE family transporter [Acidovorax benzenivorans]
MDALLFVPVAIAISLTPGPNNFCGLNNGIRAGVGAAMIATVGRAAAFAIFLTVSAVGLGAMLLASEAAFTAVKWVGAAYLFWLGWRAWRSREFNGLALDDAPAGGVAAPVRLRALIAQEFLLGITNPKAIILFAAIFPQFIDPAQPAARQFLVLGSIYLGSEFVSTAVYASFGRQIRRFIRTSRGVARLNKATGGFFMGAGGLLLATNR